MFVIPPAGSEVRASVQRADAGERGSNANLYMSRKQSFYARRGKRLLDIVFALFACFILAPIAGVVAGFVRIGLGRPVLFRQLRPGLFEEPFALLKFRSMRETRDGRGKLQPDEVRITGIGKLLRTWSLDEIPQLLNVLRGDMSLVGPRPLFMKYLPYYTQTERLRHTVRPGITGLAQVQGRNNLQWDERLDMDVQYVRNYNFALDMKILALTLARVLSHKDVALNAMVDLSDHREEENVPTGTRCGNESSEPEQ